MPTWNPDQYLKFADQRTRPCRDLANRIAAEAPTRIIDLGCGPGNSTAVLAGRWPGAHITGLDNSPDMIDAAHKSAPRHKWIAGDIAAWAEDPGAPFDIVFSNAALQWVGDHKRLFPLIMDRVAPGGALAIQVPSRADIPAHRVMRELAESKTWRDHFKTSVREWFVHDTPFYYDVLAPLAETLDFWETDYLHVMDSAAAIVEWYKGSGLRPFLEALPDDAARDRFLKDYLALIAEAYPAHADGKILFPFRRIFLIAYKPEL
jgi:trans-aconitate 2-methyltransferase